MKYQLDNIKKENRNYLKTKIDTIYGAAIKFKKNKACIIYEEPYLLNEDAIRLKNANKKNIQNIINEFRHYQFNQSVFGN